jgi:very-short-patch-repair endonuclease
MQPLNPNARRLRKIPTDAERRLWRHLRLEQLSGHKFRRQHPIGNYIVDFYCHEKRLVVEVDGGQHLESADDDKRTFFLEASGYRVLRFWNNDVLSKTEGVVARILEALDTPPPSSPKAGG